MTVSRERAPARKRGSYTPELTRQQFLDVALDLFSERGFHGATIQQLADRAQMTKGAFYHHFESKEDVLRQIHGQYAQEMLDGALAVEQRTDLEPVEKLRALIERAVVQLGSHVRHVAVFYQEFRFLSGDSYAAIRKMHDRQEEILLSVIRDGIKAGQIRDGIDPKLLMFAISGVTAWVYQWYSEGGPNSLSEIATKLADIVMIGAVTTEGLALDQGAPVSGSARATTRQGDNAKSDGKGKQNGRIKPGARAR